MLTASGLEEYFRLTKNVAENVVCVVVQIVGLTNNLLFIYSRSIFRQFFSARIKVESSIKFVLLLVPRTSGTERGICKGMINKWNRNREKYV
jgi:hypothetical protein